MYPVLFEPFGFKISSFGVMLMLAFLASALIVGRRLREQDLDPELSWTLILYGMVGGVLGAKLYYMVATSLRGGDPFYDLRAGLTWFGGLIGGTIAITLCTRIHKIPTKGVADCIASAAPFGQALGRFGCFLVGDDYGRPTDAAWGIAFPAGAPPTLVPVHPTQLYELAWLLAAGAVLWRRRRASPFLFGEYLICAGIGRFAVEILRVNPRVALGLSEAQSISIALIVLGAAGWLHFARRRPAVPG